MPVSPSVGNNTSLTSKDKHLQLIYSSSLKTLKTLELGQQCESSQKIVRDSNYDRLVSTYPFVPENMDDFNSESDSEYTSYWRDWVSEHEKLIYFFEFYT